MSAHKSIVFAVFASLMIASACSDLTPRPTEPSHRQSFSLARKTWFNVLPTAMSDEFCDPKNEIMQCYPALSKDDCVQDVQAVTTSCEQNYEAEIPARMKKSDAQTWGGTIGDCAKDAFVQRISEKGIAPLSDACKQTVVDM